LVRALAGEPLSLFAVGAEDHAGPEISEPEVDLVPMTAGRRWSRTIEAKG
jgi:hypothetical protein